ncbi:hypothetical protein O0L34_g19082 [Tuta absoluta]|nr:hypothetical protein O0L34_g19082 [Tuta absoluta]
MDKHKKKSLKIFEEDSADESIEDPYHDDGEYGSDQDYDPSSQDAGSCSSSEVLTSLQRKRPRNNSRRTKKKAKTSPTNNRSATIRPSDSSNGSSSSSASSSDDSGSSDRDDGSGCGSAGAVSSDENMGEESPSTKLPPEENQDSSDSSEIFPLAERIKKSYYSKHADYLFDSTEKPIRPNQCDPSISNACTQKTPYCPENRSKSNDNQLCEFEAQIRSKSSPTSKMFVTEQSQETLQQGFLDIDMGKSQQPNRSNSSTPPENPVSESSHEKVQQEKDSSSPGMSVLRKTTADDSDNNSLQHNVTSKSLPNPESDSVPNRADISPADQSTSENPPHSNFELPNMTQYRETNPVPNRADIISSTSQLTLNDNPPQNNNEPYIVRQNQEPNPLPSRYL